MQLTKFGQLYLRHVNDALQALEEGQEELEQCVQVVGGMVTVSYLSSLQEYLPYVTSKYLHSNPTVKTNFQLIQSTTTQVEQDLLENKCDLGLSTVPASRGLESFPLGEHPLVLIVPSTSPFAGRSSVSVRELDGLPFIAYSKICTIRHATDALLAAHGVRPQIVNEARFDNLIIGMVASSLGYAIIPEPTGLCSRRIEVIPLAESLPKRTIYLLWARGNTLSPAAERFKEYVVENPINPLDFIRENK